MKYKTYWLAGLLAPMLVATPALAIKQTMVSSVSANTVFVENGYLFGMGASQWGQLGQMGGAIRTPTYLGIDKVAVVANVQHRLAILKEDGTASFSGLSYVTYNAVLNAPFPHTGITDIAASTRTFYYIKAGQVYSWTGEAGALPLAVAGAANVKEIAASANHLVVRFNDDTVGTVGTFAGAHLCSGTTSSAVMPIALEAPVAEIATYGQTTMFRLQNGTVWACGGNSQGQLGLGDKIARPAPVKIMTGDVKGMYPGTSTVVLHMADNSMWAAGWHNFITGWNGYTAPDGVEFGTYNTDLTFVRLPVGTNPVVYAGHDVIHFRPAGTTNEIHGWGSNLSTKLGNGDLAQTEAHTPVVAFYTPIAPPPVVLAPIFASLPAPVVSLPEDPPAPPTDTAIALPFNAIRTPEVVTAAPATLAEVVVNAVIDTVVAAVEVAAAAAEAVSSAVLSVVDAVAALVAADPVVMAADPVRVAAPVVVAAPALVAADPVVKVKAVKVKAVKVKAVKVKAVKVKAVKVKAVKCNNGFGNGVQCAPGNSLNHNNAANAQGLKSVDKKGGKS